MRPIQTLIALLAMLSSTAALAAETVPAHRILREQASSFGHILDVTVDKPLDPVEIAALVKALADKMQSSRQTLVNVYLPGMPAGSAPAASAVVSGSIEVTLRSTGLDTDDAAGAGRVPTAGEPGWQMRHWDLTWPQPAGRLAISRLAQNYRAEWLDASGARRTEDLAAVPSLRGLRLDPLSRGAATSYVVRPDGGLEVHGRAGLTAKGVPIATAPPAAAGGAQPQAAPAAATAQPPPPPRRPGANSGITATTVSVIEPWPRVGESRLALARTVLPEAKPEATGVKVAAPVARPAAALEHEPRPVRAAGPAARKAAQTDDQAQIWKRLARFLQPNG